MSDDDFDLGDIIHGMVEHVSPCIQKLLNEQAEELADRAQATIDFLYRDLYIGAKQ